MAIDEMKADIEKRYFDWLYELVCVSVFYKRFI